MDSHDKNWLLAFPICAGSPANSWWSCLQVVTLLCKGMLQMCVTSIPSSMKREHGWKIKHQILKVSAESIHITSWWKQVPGTTHVEPLQWQEMRKVTSHTYEKYWKTEFSSVQSLSRVQLFATPWIAAHQASLSISNSQSPPKPMSIESVMPSNYISLCHPLLLLPSIFPSIRVFSNESDLLIRWPKNWSFSCSISPSKEHPGLISFRMDWLGLLAVWDTQESSPTPQFKSIDSSVLSFLYSPTLTSIHDHWKNHSLD